MIAISYENPFNCWELPMGQSAAKLSIYLKRSTTIEKIYVDTHYIQNLVEQAQASRNGLQYKDFLSLFILKIQSELYRNIQKVGSSESNRNKIEKKDLQIQDQVGKYMNVEWKQVKRILDYSYQVL